MIIKKVYLSIRVLVNNLKNWKRLSSNSWLANFHLDNNAKVKIPQYNLTKFIFKYPKITKINNFSYRVNQEPLFRLVISKIIKEYLIKESMIIDIGSWIGDNSIPWAINIGPKGLVLAVDPSLKNIDIVNEIAYENRLDNIIAVNAVCSSKLGEKLQFIGNLDHTEFSKIINHKSKKFLFSNTLDNIYNNLEQERKVSLIHVDVEGFELAVLKGAVSIISKYSPIIVFEMHISTQKNVKIIDFLKNSNYLIYMINEVIYGTALDCRNFIALPKNDDLDNILNLVNYSLNSNYIIKATLNANLIEVA